MAKKQQLGYKEIEERLRIIKDNHVPAEEIGYHILYSFGKGERDIARPLKKAGGGFCCVVGGY